MSKKLPSVSGKRVVHALKDFGYTVTRIKGSHHFMECDGRPSVTVPVHGNHDIARGTLRSILEDAAISQDDFIDRL